MQGALAARRMTLEHLECSLDLTCNWGYESTRKELRGLEEPLAAGASSAHANAAERP